MIYLDASIVSRVCITLLLLGYAAILLREDGVKEVQKIIDQFREDQLGKLICFVGVVHLCDD